MRNFVDLHIKKELFTHTPPPKVASELKKLGFNTIAISVESHTSLPDIIPIKKGLKDFGIDITSRLDFSPSTRSELLRLLQKNRRKVEVIGVKPITHELAIVSARDHRVDTIYYDLSDRHLLFRNSTAKICTGALEIPFYPLSNFLSRKYIYPFFSRLIREVTIAVKYKVPIILTSSARKMANLRSARDMAALAGTLGLTKGESLASISTNPLDIISRNRFKLSNEYVMEGVRLLKGK